MTMRIAHTSDWHIGRTLHGVDLHQFHAQYFDHLIEVVERENLDAVLVSGDIYDRAIPPLDAVELLSDVLRRLSERTQVILTPGNHDSAIRLGFGSALMRDSIHIRSQVQGIYNPVEITSKSGQELLVYALPYLDPDSTRSALVDCCATHAVELSGMDTAAHGELPIARSHEAVMGAAMKLVHANLTQRNSATKPATALMAHAFVTGGQPTESERDIRVGGVDSVPAGVFHSIDYLALGHLHGPQKVTVPGATARYSGSPLAFSFSEMNHKKSTTIVEFSQDGSVAATDLIPAPVPRALSDVTGTLDEVLTSLGQDKRNDWVRVTITDSTRPNDMNARIKAVYPHALVMQHQPAGGRARTREAIRVHAQVNPVEVAAAFVQEMTTVPATAQEKAVLETALDRARDAEQSA